MTLSAVIGQAQALEGREAAAQATHQALDQLGRSPVILGMVIASHNHPIQQVLSGVSTLLGDAPLLGFSTSAELTSAGQSQRSVIVALLTGDEVSARADWWEGFGDDSHRAAQQMAQTLELDQANGTLLVIADGFNGDGKQLCAALPPGNYTLAGCLAGGDLNRARTFQIGGRQSGTGGIAAALLNGKIKTSIGIGHGWQTIGAYYNVTRAHGPWVRTLNDRLVSETFGELFGYQAREWAFPPLNELVRLYPLGIEQGIDKPLLLRAPLRMESDGSLRMNTNILEGSTGHIMVGNVTSCLEAAKQATQEALDALGDAHPVLALLLADVSWQMLLQAQPGSEVEAVRTILGPDVPICGGYTFGQIARTEPNDTQKGSPELFNQQIEVILFGEAS